MSRFFRKSKKTFAVLLTIAFVLSIAAVPVFAGLSSISAPRVEADARQDLGTFEIEIEDVQGVRHEGYVELPVDYEIWEIRVTVAEGVYDALTGDITSYLWIDGERFGDGTGTGNSRYFNIGGKDGFTIEIGQALAEEAEGADLELRIAFRADPEGEESEGSVTVPSGVSGNIYATVVEVAGGQIPEGDVLVGRIDVGELQLVVRDFQSFVDFGDVEIRVTESFRGTWNDDDSLRLRLPRHFSWDEEMHGAELGDYGNVVFGDADIEDDITFRVDGRNLYLDYDGTGTVGRTAFDFTAEIIVDDELRASKGDVIADVLGDYDATPDSLVVGVFGDFAISLTAVDVPTVYAGQAGEDIAEIVMEEDVGSSIIAGRTITLTLPEWAAWDAEYDDDLEKYVMEDFDDEDLYLEFRDLRRDNREARWYVKSASTDAETIKFKDLEILLNTNARGDVIVEVGGTAGVFGEVKVAEAVALVEFEIPEPTYITRDASGQPLGDIYITEAKAGALSQDGDLVLHLNEYMRWGPFTVEVIEGDLELKTPSAAGGQQFTVAVDVESDEASTIKISGVGTAFMSALRGEQTVRLHRSSTAAVDAKVAAFDAFQPVPHVGSGVIAYIDMVAPDPPVVMMWIGSTTYTVDGEAATMDVAPFIENDRTFVPVRFIAEALGAEADWGPEDGLTEWVTLTKGDMVVTLTIGSNIISVTDGDETYTVMSDVAAQIVNDRTFLPARAVGEIFGAEFDWGPKDALTEWVSFTLP